MNLQDIVDLPYFALYACFFGNMLLLLVFYWGVFSRLSFFRVNPALPAENLPPLSVVICAKNEYQNLNDCLPQILTQDYPDFEVVVVNDASDDDTDYLLRDLRDRYPHLSIVFIEKNLNFFVGKKFPLSIGIKEARHDLLVLTDADCRPESPQWLRYIAATYGPSTEIVLGYSGYKPCRGLLGLFQRFDTFQTALMYLSLALTRMPYMGVGRNLSYRKSLFYKKNGFISHYHIPSGDDDLFVNQAATPGNTRVCLHPDAFTWSTPKRNFSEWLTQKRRHLRSGRYYKGWHKFVLGAFGIGTGLFYALFALLLILGFPWYLGLGVFFFRFVNQVVVYHYAIRRLKAGKFLLISPLLEPLYLLLMAFLAATNKFTRQSRWK